MEPLLKPGDLLPRNPATPAFSRRHSRGDYCAHSEGCEVDWGWTVGYLPAANFRGHIRKRSSRVSPLDSAIVSASDRGRPLTLSFRRFALALAAFIVLPPISLAAFVLLVDPYYVFGSPSVPGINVVRPFYELHVLAAKPYQVQRIKPAAVTLGSSRVEVGLDPRHAGWADRTSSTSACPRPRVMR